MRIRRDPRSERQMRLIPGTERRRFSRTHRAPVETRPRRDPRALRNAARTLDGVRPRIDWSFAAPAAAIHQKVDGPNAASDIRIIAEPAFLVLAVLDQSGGSLSDHDRQSLAAARAFADADGGAVVVLAACDVAGLDLAGADRVMPLSDGLADDDDPEKRMSAVLAAIGALSPRHVVFAESTDGGADLARRVAARLGERLFSGVETVSGGTVARRTHGGTKELRAKAPRLMSIAEGAFAPHEGQRHEACVIDAAPFEPAPARLTVSPLPADPDSIALSEADFILSAGNGVTDWQSFAELGQALGATRAGSRVVCDEGHLPRDRQVGASGTLVTARCYLAFGISGAPQHLQGITEVKHVVAINTDLHAEMIKRADLAIIADAQDVMPALIAHARGREIAGREND